MNEYTIAENPATKKEHAWLLSRLIKKTWLPDLICSLLIMLFSYAAVSKLTDYNTFAGQLSKSPFLELYAATIVWLVPVTECIIALLLLFKNTRLTGLFASFALMLAFTIYIYMMLHYSYYVPCSCGGALAMMSWTQHFWFNVFFTMLALTGILLVIITPGKVKKQQL